jgi:hypothetical protein
MPTGHLLALLDTVASGQPVAPPSPQALRLLVRDVCVTLVRSCGLLRPSPAWLRERVRGAALALFCKNRDARVRVLKTLGRSGYLPAWNEPDVMECGQRLRVLSARSISRRLSLRASTARLS